MELEFYLESFAAFDNDVEAGRGVFDTSPLQVVIFLVCIAVGDYIFEARYQAVFSIGDFVFREILVLVVIIYFCYYFGRVAVAVISVLVGVSFGEFFVAVAGNLVELVFHYIAVVVEL